MSDGGGGRSGLGIFGALGERCGEGTPEADRLASLPGRALAGLQERAAITRARVASAAAAVRQRAAEVKDGAQRAVESAKRLPTELSNLASGRALDEDYERAGSDDDEDTDPYSELR